MGQAGQIWQKKSFWTLVWAVTFLDMIPKAQEMDAQIQEWDIKVP